MSPEKIMDSVSVVHLKKLRQSLLHVELHTGWSRLRYLSLAYANDDLLEELKISTRIVMIYLSKPSEKVLDEYSPFLILSTPEHLFNIDMRGGEGERKIDECIGVSYEWFNKKGIYKDYAKVYVRELHGLDTKPF